MIDAIWTKESGYTFTGVLAANCRIPAVEFTLSYTAEENTLTVMVEYRIAEYVEKMPRFGFEFGVDQGARSFTYIGYGPTESYCDKHIAAEYGMYSSTADTNYDRNYVRPQESGSHYACRYLAVDGVVSVTADAPFSCSVNPYTTKQLLETTHDFELMENDFVNVCIDLAMRGIGSHSCGPELPNKYEIPRSGKNVFHFVF